MKTAIMYSALVASIGHNSESVDPAHRSETRTGRGAGYNPKNRFHAASAEAVDDGWWQEPEPNVVSTTVREAPIRTILSYNDSSDIGFDRSINPYRGCEHGCIYCFARPTHAYYDLSPGLDFETQLFTKPDAAARLRYELSKPGYQVQPIAIGTNTDPYQPIEKRYRVTREVLEVLSDANHPVTVLTKGSLILRDLDLLSDMAQRRLVRAAISIPTLDRALKRTLEPLAPDPAKRLKVIDALADAGISTGVMVAPVIPALTDSEMEAVIHAAASAGADRAGYVLLRLPMEVLPLFDDWLRRHYPMRAEHVLSLMRQLHGGREYDGTPRKRQTGEGVFAQLIAKRFAKACARADIGSGQGHDRHTVGGGGLDCSAFVPPMGQRALF